MNIKTRNVVPPSSGDKWCSHCDETVADFEYFNTEFKEWWGVCKECFKSIFCCQSCGITFYKDDDCILCPECAYWEENVSPYVTESEKDYK